ncbi:protein argonaute-2-like, partial [Anopheles cruzii]|uniref:protein argonaute-2-like n=1 Tax=Anopheles cruzii TaxID=68878 RepID=UPI0022EC348F
QQDPQKQQQQGGATQPKEQQQAGPNQPKEQKQQKQQGGPNQPKEQKQQKQQKQQGGPNQPKEQKQQKQQGGPSQPKEQQQGGQSQYHQGQQPQGSWNQPGQQPHRGTSQDNSLKDRGTSQDRNNIKVNSLKEHGTNRDNSLRDRGTSQDSSNNNNKGRTPSVASTKSSSSGDGVLPSLPEDLSNMQVSKQKIHRTNLYPVLYRSGAHGKRGKPVTVEVNSFIMQIDKLKRIAFHYNVTIEPDRPEKFFRPVFAQFCQETYPNVCFAYDGQKSAYTAHKVDDSRATVTFHPSDRGKEMQFKVTVKLAATVDLGSLRDYMQSYIGSMVIPMAAIQCLNVVLRCPYEGNDRVVRFDRRVYEVPRNRIDLGKGYQLFYSLFQTVNLGSKPYVNVDVFHKTFRNSDPLAETFVSLIGGNLDTNRPLDGRLVKELRDYVSGMKILYLRPPDNKRIQMKCKGLRDAANAQQFTLDDGTKLTVADYFSRKLNYKLRYPTLPVVHVHSLGSHVFIPPELCLVLPGQAPNKTPEECRANIKRLAATSPQERKEKIMRLSTNIAYNNSPTLIDFGVGVGKEFEKLPARIIDPPTVVYAGNDEVRPTRGVWRAEGKRFTEPSSTIANKTLCWRILNLDGSTNETMVKEFGKQIYKHARKCNMKLEPFCMRTTSVRVRNVCEAVRDLSKLLLNIKKDQPAITIVIIPSCGVVYAKVKQTAELDTERIGLLTQCIQGKTVKYKRTDGSTINYILSKMNAKMNGCNYRLALHTQPLLAKGRIMYIGADVSHPSGDDILSIVGVTAVYDLHCFRYNCSLRLQKANDEMVRDLENIVHRHVQLYQKYNGNLPERIMYYRDGVSNGQFAEILMIELQAIHAALARIGANFKPPVTFIVVQKRHRKRFFPVGNCPTEGKNGNVPPGTVIDRDITAPNRFEFYLVSHATVKGVVKPTKYVVLYDESECNSDQLQAMTNNLCYMFARCNRAVSYPTPTYYAHHAAYRGRIYLKNRGINMNDLEAACREIQISADVHEKYPMFFI